MLDHAEQITVFLGIAVSHDEKVASWQTLARLEYKKMIDFEEKLNGEFNFEVQESGEGELGACESTDLGRKLSSDETIQTPNS